MTDTNGEQVRRMTIDDELAALLAQGSGYVQDVAALYDNVETMSSVLYPAEEQIVSSTTTN